MGWKKQKKLLTTSIAGLFLFIGTGHAQETIDLFPDEPGELICWTEARSDPRPVKIHFLRVNLQSRALEVFALPGDDPDGDGPAESQLTPPTILLNEFNAIAAVNANAFAALNAEDVSYGYWYEGQPVDIHGLVVSQGKTVSPIESDRVPFWIDCQHRPHIGDPANGDLVMEAVSDWFSPLLVESRIIPDSSDMALHPRTALGFDDSGAWLLLVVVDGRQPCYSEGVTLYELAKILQSQGCTQSINLDGGGSSIMLIQGHNNVLRTFNRPSGTGHRPVPVMLGVRKKIETSKSGTHTDASEE